MYRVKYTDPEFITKSAELLKEWGVLVIEDVFTPSECREKVERIHDGFTTINPTLNEPTAWTKENLPPIPRAGLFQRIFGNLPPVWEIRTDPRIRHIFETVYSDLRGYEVTDFVTSIDAVNVHPPIGPYQEDSKDWAHLDQTYREGDKPEHRCVQGQVVLNESTASFRCSPKSHSIFGEILDAHGVSKTSKDNWCMFKHESYPLLKEAVEDAGGEWQVPIKAPTGSVILWLSSTIHSAISQSKTAVIDTSDPFSDWRFVVYTCYRPKSEVDKAHFKRLQRCVEENRLTNHWGSMMFSKTMRFSRTSDPMMKMFVDEPEKVYDFKELKPKLTPELLELISPRSETSTSLS